MGNSYSYPPVFRALGKCMHSTGWFQLVEQEVDLTKNILGAKRRVYTPMLHFKLSPNSHALCQFLCLMIHNGSTVMPEEFPVSHASKVMRGGMVVNMEHYGVAFLYLRLV